MKRLSTSEGKKLTRPSRAQCGQGLISYALLITMAALVIIGGLYLFGEATGNTLGDVVDSLFIEEEPTETPPPGPEDVTVSVLDQDGNGIENVTVLAYDGEGHFLAKSGTTGASGSVIFKDLDPGAYQFRADQQLKAFWSDVINVPQQTSAVIKISATTVTVNVVNGYGSAISDVNVYAFTGDGSYTGMRETTGKSGSVVFNLTDDKYKFRADYNGTAYWSDTIAVPDTTSTTILIKLTTVEVQVSDYSGKALSGLTVDAYIRTKDGSSELAGNAITDGVGIARFELENGTYRFVTNYKGKDFASDTIDVPDTTKTSIRVNAPFTVKVIDKRGNAQNNIDVYGYQVDFMYHYIGMASTGNDGLAYFTNLENGRYIFMAVKAGGKKYAWSEFVDIPPGESVTITLSR